jgi:nucleotide-binding universal stress UspA family protein
VRGTLRRILVGLDGSPLAETIVEAVCTLSERLRADVVLLHVVDVPEMVRAIEPGPRLDEIVAQESARARAYLDGVAATIRRPGLAVHVAVSAGSAANEIVRFAERERIDLVALATHGRAGIGRWIHGSVADAVLHDARVPLLLLRPTTEGERITPAVSRLVVPLDGSSLAEDALPVAEELARALAVPIVIVRIIEPLGLPFATEPFVAAPAYVDYQRIFDVLQRDAEQYVDGTAARLRTTGLAVETRVVTGIAAERIAMLARERAGSLIVLTTHGRSGWRAVVLGSVARRVVLLAGGPVLVTRPAAAHR